MASNSSVVEVTMIPSYVSYLHEEVLDGFGYKSGSAEFTIPIKSYDRRIYGVLDHIEEVILEYEEKDKVIEAEVLSKDTSSKTDKDNQGQKKDDDGPPWEEGVAV